MPPLQVGFIQFIVLPYWRAWTRLFPALEPHTELAQQNLLLWKGKRESKPDAAKEEENARKVEP